MTAPETPDPVDLDRHWYVPDAHDLFCLACGLPQENQRHAPKPEAA